jgi:hypothetical protein
MEMAMSTRPSHHLRIEEKNIMYQKRFYDGSLTKCAVGNLLRMGEQPRQVFIEWTGDGTIGQQRYERLCQEIESTALFLNLLETPESLRILHCVGYAIDPKIRRLSLVFGWPQPAAVTGSVISLEYSIRDDSWLRRHDLGQRFKLAHTLATSLMELHNVGWLHKNISSSKVVFFPPTASSSIDITMPYLIGFAPSGNELREFPWEFDESVSDRAYRHPDYEAGRLRYSPSWDYYSLGLVLLEIGLGKLLHDMAKHAPDSRETMKEYLLRLVPRLKSVMGNCYHDAVLLCLSGGFYSASNEPEVALGELSAEFEKGVVHRLARCFA